MSLTVWFTMLFVIRYLLFVICINYMQITFFKPYPSTNKCKKGIIFRKAAK